MEDLRFVVDGVEFVMKPVEGGTFVMSSFYHHPHVTLDDFYIGETQVTQELWRKIMISNPSHFGGDSLPVEQVSWNDIMNIFLPKLNIITKEQTSGMVFRLPTEAEWEYAAMGGNKSKGYRFSGSDSIDEVAWYVRNTHQIVAQDRYGLWKRETYNSRTHPVKSKAPNELGIYGMSGNVNEWCHDLYESYMWVRVNPHGPSDGKERVQRGGDWLNDEQFCRVSYRGLRSEPYHRLYTVGFRLVLSPYSLS